ncbi:MAG TPA: PHB depolymerase family esterase, partial [Anaerolineae bacterium]|nr:PHB depolymerase family esterase [Anaerolineae bacterium]
MLNNKDKQKVKQKNISIILLVVLALLILMGCSSEQTASATDAATTSVAASPAAQTPTTTTGSTETESSESDVATESPDGPPEGARMGGGEIDKSGDAELQTMISEVVPKFEQFEYTDSETGLTLPYNLFIPDNYDPAKSYPLVTFIGDASTVGQDTSIPLTQGYGGLIWATATEQAKHESFVLVPAYPEVILDDHGSFTTTDYVELTVSLLNSVTGSYSIDTNRLYVTGQSMGGMTFLLLSAVYPDLFAAELFVSSQWDISTLENLASQKFFYIAAAGDEKASGGQAEVKDMLARAGISYSTAVWDATWSSDEFETAVASMRAEGNSINIATFELDTVLPEGVEVGTNEHMYSFDYAYKVEDVRDWLFEQTKASTEASMPTESASVDAYAEALTFDNSAWNYDAENDVYWQIGVQ